MILKSYLVEKNISSLKGYPVILCYGENIGLKDDLKIELKKEYIEHEVIRLNQEEIFKNEKLLNSEINNDSLFSQKKIIIISGVSDKLKNTILEITENIKENIKILLFANVLDKKSSLRSFAEKNKKVATIACYQDNSRTLSEYVRSNLSGFKGLNQELINLLIENSGNDRKTLSMEIEKIKSYFIKKEINQNKVKDLINCAFNLDFEELRDSCFDGNKVKLNKNLSNISIQNEDVYFYLSLLNNRVQKLFELQNQLSFDKKIEVAIDNVKPKIFWKDKPIFIRQVNKWNLRKLEKAKKYIIETEIKIKTKFNNYNSIIMKDLLIKLFRLANSPVN